MCLKATILTEALSTVVTLVGLVSSVSANMFLEITICLKALSTVVTLVGLVSSVSANMFLEITICLKALSTVVTLVGLVSSAAQASSQTSRYVCTTARWRPLSLPLVSAYVFL